MANVRHNGALPNAVVELGYDQVMYFEGVADPVPATITLSRPARKLIIINYSTSVNIYLRVDGQPASVHTYGNFEVNENIKIRPNGTFTMDLDTITTFSIAAPSSAQVEGVLGFKGKS